LSPLLAFSTCAPIARAASFNISPNPIIDRVATPFHIEVLPNDSVDDAAFVFDSNGDFVSGYYGTDVDDWGAIDDYFISAPSGAWHVLLVRPADLCTGGGTYQETLDDVCYVPSQAETWYVGTAAPSSFPVLSVISTTSAASMIAGIGNGVQETGTNLWVIAAAAIGITAAFWLMRSVAELFPDGKSDNKIISDYYVNKKK